MQEYIYQALKDFRSIYSRHSSGLLFCAVVIGFMATSEMLGVSVDRLINDRYF